MPVRGNLGRNEAGQEKPLPATGNSLSTEIFTQRDFTYIRIGKKLNTITGHFFIKNFLLLIHQSKLFGNILSVQFGMETVSRGKSVNVMKRYQAEPEARMSVMSFRWKTSGHSRHHTELVLTTLH